jgi:hypothetical protein
MSTGSKTIKFGGTLVLCTAVLCAGSTLAYGSSTQSHKKAKKPPLPPLPSGPTGPVQQIPLDSIAAVPPQVSYQDHQLTIVAPNSTLADILRAVRKQTGAEIEIPAAPERVVTHLGPGPAREVLADLLNGSRFNYVMLGSPGNDAILTRVVLVPKTPDAANPAPAPTEPQQGVAQAGAPPAVETEAGDANDAEQADENAEENGDQPAEAEQQQPANQPEQPSIKTPQQMLQEMQQRQLMMQQQQGQQAGQPPAPRPPQTQPQ